MLILFNNMSLFKKKRKINKKDSKIDTINYKYTICEKCLNDECSSVGERNIHHGYNINSCKSYKGPGKNVPHPYDEYDDPELAYPFGFDPNYYKT